MKTYRSVEELIENCIGYFERQSFSQPRIDRYKAMWKCGIIPFMSKNSICNYDAAVGDEFIQRCFTGSMITPGKRDMIRSISVLSEFQLTGAISKRRSQSVERKLFGTIGQLMEQFLMHLESLRRNKITLNDHRLYLHRFLIFLESKQILDVEEIRETQILMFVSTITNNNIGIVSSIRYFLKYLFDNQVISTDLSDTQIGRASCRERV